MVMMLMISHQCLLHYRQPFILFRALLHVCRYQIKHETPLDQNSYETKIKKKMKKYGQLLLPRGRLSVMTNFLLITLILSFVRTIVENINLI
jgi:hypothetical protein